MIRKLVEKQLRYSIPIVMVFFFITGIFGFYALQLTIDPSFSALVSSDSQFNTYERVLANSKGNTDAFLLFFKPDESSRLTQRPISVTDENVINRISTYNDILLQSPYVTNVIGPIISDDEQYAQLILQVETPRSRDGFSIVINDVRYYVEQVGEIAGIDTTLTGFPLLLNRVNTLLIEDNLTTLAFTFIVVFLVLIWYFRDLAVTFIALSIPTISLIILAGLMALLDVSITITLAAVGILVLGISVSFTIHVIIGYEKYIEQGLDAKDALIEAMEHLHIAIIASFITTLAGFTALLFGVSPSSQSQGLVLSMAISIIFFVTFGLLPCLLYIFASKYKPSKVKVFEKIKEYLVKLARIQAQFPKTVIFGVVIATFFFIYGASQVGFDTSNENWIPSNDPIQQSFRESAYAFGDDFSSLQVVVESTRGDLRDIDVVRDLQQVARILESHPDIERVDSVFKEIELDNQVIINTFSNPQNNRAFNSDYSLATFTIRVISFDEGADGSSGLLREIQQIIDENEVFGAKLTLFGDTIRFQELGESLGRDTGITTVISFVLVFIIASFTYMSIRVGIMSILPILISIIWAVGIMGYTGVPFTALSTGLIALVLGIGIDFSIHLVNSIYNYLKEGKDLSQALEYTLNYSGGALVLTTITTFIGFASLILATLLGIQRLGLALAFSIVSVFLVSIILVPAIISLGYARKLKRELRKN
ncbi:MAG: MMPL family transporter [Nanoarchaeota archaeon]|nr:MMPL family transporter [Nanoarchaeota archaeon]